MILQISLGGADESISLGFADPEVLRERNGINVHRYGDDKTENEDDDLRAAFVPAGDAVHGAVEPRFDAFAKSFEIIVGVIEESQKCGPDLWVLDFDDGVASVVGGRNGTAVRAEDGGDGGGEIFGRDVRRKGFIFQRFFVGAAI